MSLQSLQRKTALVLGMTNQRSLAWSCARSLVNGEFHHVIVTYQNERFQKTVESLVSNYNHQLQQNVVSANDKTQTPERRLSCLSCDVLDESMVDSLFCDKIPSLLNSEKNGVKLNAIVHCIAYAPSQAMKDSQSDFALLETTQKDFELAHSVSAHSLLAVSRHALPLLTCSETNRLESSSGPTNTASITALTYLGSTRAVRNYNVMGPAKASLEACVRGLAMELSPPPHRIRVNAVSAGPVNTLAARGIRNFNELKQEAEGRSFLKRCVTGEEVGNLVEFIAGSKASGITAQVLFCDGGYSSWGGG
jgi:enoyl-[acyl-carrier protein] reductase I